MHAGSIEIVTDTTVTCGVAPFRFRGRLGLVVVVKAAFGLQPGAAMQLLPPPELIASDRFADHTPLASLVAPSDLAPYLPRCDVLFRGHAYVGSGQARSARLAIVRDGARLLERSLRVAHQGKKGASESPGGARFAIAYEHAIGGASEDANPVGTPNPALLDVHSPHRPAAWGPVSPRWPSRRTLAAGGSLSREEIPDHIDWRVFQAAPPEQQIEYLRGGEWVLLEGLHPRHHQLQSQIPRCQAMAKAMRADGGLETVELWADTVAIDGDSGTCTISWRGRMSADDSVVLAGLALADRTVAWGDLAASALARREATSEATQPASFGRQDSLGSVPAAWRRTPAQPPASDRESAARRGEGTPWGPLGPTAGSGPSPWAGSLEDTWALGGPIAASTPPRTLTPEPWVPPIDSPAAPPTGADASPPPSPIEPSPVAPRATLPTKLGRDNATPDAVAGFLSAFELPPRQS